jgi:hypothetical protein
MAVFTGVIGDFHIAAFVANIHVGSIEAGAAVYDGGNGFLVTNTDLILVFVSLLIF